MMSEKRFERWNDHSCKIKDNQENTLLNWEDVIHKLNEQQDTINDLNGELEESSAFIIEQRKEIQTLKEENEQLRKQIQNYEQLISNSYVGEEETLDGFVGKYVIWENELQKYKNKNEMIDDG